MTGDSSDQRDPAMEAAVDDLADLMSDGKRGAFDPGCLDRAVGLRTWITDTPGMEGVDLDLENPRVFMQVLRSVDTYAEEDPVAQRTVGRGNNFTTTQAVRAIGWLIRVDDRRGSGSGLEKRRTDAKKAEVGIDSRQLGADRWQAWHHLGDIYVLYLRRVLEDPKSRTEILGRVRAEARQGQSQVEPSSRSRRRALLIAGVAVVATVATALVIVFWPRWDNPWCAIPGDAG